LINIYIYIYQLPYGSKYLLRKFLGVDLPILTLDIFHISTHGRFSTPFRGVTPGCVLGVSRICTAVLCDDDARGMISIIHLPIGPGQPPKDFITVGENNMASWFMVFSGGDIIYYYIYIIYYIIYYIYIIHIYIYILYIHIYIYIYIIGFIDVY